MVVEDAGLGGDGRRAVFDAAFDSPQLFRFQVFVGLVAPHAIVQLRERGQTKRFVIGGIHLPVAAEAVAGIYAGIKKPAPGSSLKGSVERRSRGGGDEAGREREPL